MDELNELYSTEISDITDQDNETPKFDLITPNIQDTTNMNVSSSNNTTISPVADTDPFISSATDISTVGLDNEIGVFSNVIANDIQVPFNSNEIDFPNSVVVDDNFERDLLDSIAHESLNVGDIVTTDIPDLGFITDPNIIDTIAISESALTTVSDSSLNFNNANIEHQDDDKKSNLNSSYLTNTSVGSEDVNSKILETSDYDAYINIKNEPEGITEVSVESQNDSSGFNNMEESNYENDLNKTLDQSMAQQLEGISENNIIAPNTNEGPQLCIRQGCTNIAVSNSEWENEYCSNECVTAHCQNVFKCWIQRNENKTGVVSN